MAFRKTQSIVMPLRAWIVAGSKLDWIVRRKERRTVPLTGAAKDEGRSVHFESWNRKGREEGGKGKILGSFGDGNRNSLIHWSIIRGSILTTSQVFKTLFVSIYLSIYLSTPKAPHQAKPSVQEVKSSHNQ